MISTRPQTPGRHHGCAPGVNRISAAFEAQLFDAESRESEGMVACPTCWNCKAVGAEESEEFSGLLQMSLRTATPHHSLKGASS
eukprot:906750-Amphidinium_carterae.1